MTLTPEQRDEIGRNLDQVVARISQERRHRSAYDARQLTEYFQSSPINNVDLDNLIRRCENFSQLNIRGKQMSSDTKDKFYNIFEMFDNVFFWGLLTRRVRTSGSQSNLPLVRLKFRAYNHPDFPPYTLGVTDWDSNSSITLSPTISIFALDSRLRVNRSGWHMITTLVHEMCHAYLGLFADERAPGHHEWVRQNHGSMFWQCLHFIFLTLAKHSRLQSIRDCLKEVCKDARYKGYSGLPVYLNYDTLEIARNR
ncbi:hypothetical protein F5Y18DRAFT_421593 [Xylariaceae sp. FL1019]|nr:hypothetical protein F5Y18DRAFT_421593 [Xylariaceae sp. FL1019]